MYFWAFSSGPPPHQIAASVKPRFSKPLYGIDAVLGKYGHNHMNMLG
jgi:hypothetical protein